MKRYRKWIRELKREHRGAGGGGGIDVDVDGDDDDEEGNEEDGADEEEIGEFETITGKRLPSKVRKWFRQGKLRKVFRWMSKNGHRLSRSQISRLELSLNRRSGRLRGSRKSTVTKRYRKWIRELKREHRGGGGGGGIDVDVDVDGDDDDDDDDEEGNEEDGADEEEIGEFETITGKRLPSKVRKWFRQGKLGKVFRWMKKNGHRLDERKIVRLEASLKRRARGMSSSKRRKATRRHRRWMKSLRKTYKISGGGGVDVDVDGGLDGDDGDDAAEEDESAVFEKFAERKGVSFPSDVRAALERGDQDAVMEWFMKLDGLETSDFNWISRQLKTTTTGKSSRVRRRNINKHKRWVKRWKSWHKKEYKLKRNRGGNGGGGRFRGRKVTSRNLRKLRRLNGGKKFSREVETSLKSGNYESFFRWVKRENINVNGFKGLSNGLRREMKSSWSSWGSENGISGSFGGGGSVGGGGDFSGEVGDATSALKSSLGLSSEEVEELSAELSADGDPEVIFTWIIDNDVELSRSEWRRLSSSFKGFRSSKWKSFYGRMDRWYRVEYKQSQSRNREVNGFKRSAFRAVKALADRKSVPKRFRAQVRGGDADAIISFLSSGKSKITRSRWRSFQRSYRSAGISGSLFSRIESWYSGACTLFSLPRRA